VSPAPKGTEQTDAVLMIRAQADDADAFAELYDRHSARAFRVARAVCSDIGRAEDAVQEGFLAVWRSRASYRADTGSFQAWSMQIVRHRAIDSFRKSAARPQLQTAGEEAGRTQADRGAISTQDAVDAESERDAMLTSLRLLPDAQAEVMVLAFYGELSHSEIATQLDLSPGTVKGRMRLGLEKLRREMSTSDLEADRGRRPPSRGVLTPR
jgi:RNA polymerase sigma-70 factor, ECF subfamily